MCMYALGDQTPPTRPAEVFKIVKRWKCGSHREYSGIYYSGWKYETRAVNVSTRKSEKLTKLERSTGEIELGFHVFPTKADALRYWQHYKKMWDDEDNVLMVFNADPEDFVARNTEAIYPEAVYHKLTFMRIEHLPKV